MYAASHCVEYYINTLWTENMIPSSDPDSKTNSSHRLSSFIKMNGHDFTLQFENLQHATGRNKTWLCQIRRVNGGEGALQVFENEGSKHAEEICLQANEVAIKKADRYEITWYLSWSSCERCAPQIIEFVEKHHNVKLNIFVSRLFRHQSSSHRKGLRALSQHERIGLKVMTLTDFKDCFDRFVGEGTGFETWADPPGNSEIYAAILKEITGADPRLPCALRLPA
ncbi:DNA dC-_dU-editing enzyme APOBEC-3C-like isoform X2 [Acipenser ruthenus]|uniref:DNA dC->dU-editing enzyme APOBEC-3C-like isoform X2 n=1 Tax=Acipenser ruthenus TaxID=7906 RepID=UPI00274109CF|nr:DNA dC->dU-editing enzyme APOBEC-3C-like isoform X2 [Acipenser ruthenus]